MKGESGSVSFYKQSGRKLSLLTWVGNRKIHTSVLGLYSQECNVAGMGEEEKILVDDEVRVVGTGVGGVDMADLWLAFILTSCESIERRSNIIWHIWKDHSDYYVEETLQGSKAKWGGQLGRYFNNLSKRLRWLKWGVNRDSENGEISGTYFKQKAERICYELDVQRK